MSEETISTQVADDFEDVAISNVKSNISSESTLFQEDPNQEFELSIEQERILNVLDRTIKRLEIVVRLPKLIANDGYLMQPYLSQQDLRYVLTNCKKYSPENGCVEEMPNTRNVFAPTMLKESIRDTKFDFHLSEAIETVCRHVPAFKLCPNPETDVSDVAQSFINCFVALRATALDKLKIGAFSERGYERHIRETWENNEWAKEKIKSTLERLELQRSKINKELEIKNKMIEEYSRNIESLREKCHDEIHKKVNDSERTMALEWHNSETKQIELAAEQKTKSAHYSVTLDQHLAMEKALRAKRFKVETRLKSWLDKYDTDVGQRHSELEKFTAAYEKEKIDYEELKKSFEEQKIIYNALMAERDEEERIINEKKCQMILRAHSARIIQAGYKAYKARKLARKMARKRGKKSSKAAQVSPTLPLIKVTELDDQEMDEKVSTLGSRRSSRRVSTSPLGVTDVFAETKKDGE